MKLTGNLQEIVFVTKLFETYRNVCDYMHYCNYCNYMHFAELYGIVLLIQLIASAIFTELFVD